jgi:hypothetical protein
MNVEKGFLDLIRSTSGKGYNAQKDDGNDKDDEDDDHQDFGRSVPARAGIILVQQKGHCRRRRRKLEKKVGVGNLFFKLERLFFFFFSTDFF